MMMPRRMPEDAYRSHRSCSHRVSVELWFCGGVACDCELGGWMRWLCRTVWTRVGPQGSGIGGRVGRAQAGCLLARVRL